MDASSSSRPTWVGHHHIVKHDSVIDESMPMGSNVKRYTSQKNLMHLIMNFLEAHSTIRFIRNDSINFVLPILLSKLVLNTKKSGKGCPKAFRGGEGVILAVPNEKKN